MGNGASEKGGEKQLGSRGLELHALCVCVSREDVLLRVCFTICELKT